MPGLHFESSIDFEKLDRQLQLMETKISDLTRSVQKSGDDMDATFRRVGTAVGAYFSFQALSGFAMQVANVRGEFQQLEVAFNTMLGSKEKADKLFAEVVQLAAKTPFSLTELGQGSKMLLAFKEPTEQVGNTLKRLGDLAAGASVPVSDLIRAYGKVSAKGKMQAEELNMFAERGIPIISELAKVVGATDKEIYKMAEQGQIGFTELQQAIKNMTNEGGMFFNLMEEQSKTITGLISNLGDAWDRMMNQMGENNQGFITDSIEGLIYLVENYEQVIDILKVIAATYGTYKAATIAASLATNGLTIAENLHYAALVIAEKAQKLLNRTMLANPYVAVATVLAGIVTSLVLFGKKAKEVSLAQEAMARVSEKVSDSYAKQKGEIEQLLSTARNQELTDEQRIEAINKLKEIIPDYNASLSEEGRLINENTAAIEAYLKQLEIKIKMTAVQDEMAELWKKEREQIKMVERAQAEYNRTRQQNRQPDVVYGGEAGIAGSVARVQVVDYADSAKKQAEKDLQETRNAINELKGEYKSAEKSLADFFKTVDDSGTKSIKTIEDLKKELSELENQRSKATDINDQAELDRLARLIIAKKQEIEKFKIEMEKSEKRSDLEIFEDEIKKKKELYTQFENYKKVVSEEEAREMYADLLKQGEEYTDYLQTLLSSLPAGDKKAIVATEIVSTEKKDRKDTSQALEELLRRTATFNQKLLELDSKYQAEKALLEKEGAKENLEILTQQYQSERRALIEANQLKSDSYKWIYEDFERMNRKALRDYIARLKEEVEAKQWSDEAKLMLSEKLAQAEQKLADLVPDRLNDVANLLRDAASLAGEFDENLANALETASNLAAAAANIATGLASGNMFQVAGGIIQGLTALVSFATGIESASKSTEKLVEQLNRMNTALERQAQLIDMFNGEAKMLAYSQVLERVQRDLDNVKKRMERFVELNRHMDWAIIEGLGLDRNNVENWSEEDWLKYVTAKGDENLDELYDKWMELQQAQRDYFLQQAEYATGISFDGFVDEFLEALKAGENSAADFADNVEDMLRTAIIQGFKTQYLMEALEPFYKQFAEFSEDGLSEEEIMKLRERLQEIFGDASDAFEALGDLGVDLSGAGDSANSLAGAIKGVTEETASIIAGRLNSMHLTMNESLRIAQRSVLHQAEIAANTRRLENIETYLRDMRTGGGDNNLRTKRAGGF